MIPDSMYSLQGRVELRTNRTRMKIYVFVYIHHLYGEHIGTLLRALALG